MKPIVLGANQPLARFYRGGDRIARFRGAAVSVPFTPEDWVGSTTSLFDDAATGPTRLPGGELLAAVVDADPLGWLGPAHVARWGSDTALLVKLLDAGERLPVHVHPDAGFGHEHLGLSHGKAEAWVMLADAEVHLGFSREVGLDELAAWVRDQDVSAMLTAMNPVTVCAGDSVLVPPGLPHAIGAGAFLVEVQEPTDLSILLEWRDFRLDGERDGHLGLGFPVALVAVDRGGWDADRLAALVARGTGRSGPVLPAGAERWFRVERTEVAGTARLDAGYSIVVVTDGRGTIARETGDDPLEVAAGSTVLTPYAAGDLEVTGELVLLRCRPPVG